MAVTINGVAARWGLPSDLAITESSVGSMILQSHEATKQSKKEQIADADGDTVTEAYFDPQTEATFEYVVKGTGIADSKVQAKIPAPGTVLTITVTSTEVGESWNSTKWTVQPGARLSHSNVGFVRVSLPLLYIPAITAAAS